MILIASLLPNGLFLAGVALFVVVLLRRWHRYYGRRPRGKKDLHAMVSMPRPVAESKRSLSTAPPEFLQWQVELHETARDMKAELDSKLIALQVLIESARQHADRLEQLLARHKQLQDLDRATPADDHCMQTMNDTIPPAQQTEIHALARAGSSASQIAQRTGVPLGDVELILSLRSRRVNPDYS